MNPRSAYRNFYILAVSQKGARLFFCDRTRADEIKLPQTVPTDLRQSQKSAQIIHDNHDIGREDGKLRIQEYFRRIDQGLASVLKDAKAPMVLATVDYLQPLYKSVNNYAHLLPESVSGNPDRSTPRLLHQKALRILTTGLKRF